MGVFRRIEDLLKKSDDKTVSYSDAEKLLRLKALQEDLGKFNYEADGFTYEFESGVEKVNWSDILHIDAYKINRGTYEELCLEIFWLYNKWTISEETPGWYQFLNKIKEAFPSIPANWDGTIAQPPFATNHTVLYQRKDSE
jgi:hypothetical protein